jgi:hypothetical protein
MKFPALAVVLAIVPAAAFAQGSNIASMNESKARWQPWSASAPMFNNSHAAIGTPARDGCINIPGEAHNSADCSRIDASDKNTAMNTPSVDLAGRPTGATENAERNARILSGRSDN